MEQRPEEWTKGNPSGKTKVSAEVIRGDEERAGERKVVTGIENIEVFLEENDEWQFHFSKVTEIHWNSEKRQLDVTINPPCCVGIEYNHGRK